MEIKGIITAMVTPMDEDQQIDYTAARELVRKLLSKGVDGLFILGTNGEAHALTNEERLAFAKTIVDEVGGRVPVYAGVGENSTAATITLAKEMEKLNVDALSVITPYFIPPSQEELIEHYRRIASAVALPILIYNMPGKTGVNVEPETVQVLADISNLVGIKDSSGNLDNMKRYIACTKGKDFAVLSGSDSLILAVLEAGGAGGVSATSNLITDTIVSIYKYWQAGKLEEAKIAQAAIEPLRVVLKFGTIPSVLKASLNLAGIQVGSPRLPVMVPNEENMEKIKQMVKGYQL